MTISSFFRAALVAVAALTLASQSALAANTIKGSKSNGSEFNACVKGGGTVKTDAKGNKDCTPKGAPSAPPSKGY